MQTKMQMFMHINTYHSHCLICSVLDYSILLRDHGLRTPNEGINQRNLKIWADEADKMLRPYLKIWDWDWIFGYAVKAISSLGVRSPCKRPSIYYVSKRAGYVGGSRKGPVLCTSKALEINAGIPTLELVITDIRPIDHKIQPWHTKHIKWRIWSTLDYSLVFLAPTTDRCHVIIVPLYFYMSNQQIGNSKLDRYLLNLTLLSTRNHGIS